MDHREDLLSRIRREEETLHRQIEALQNEAERYPGGIREYRRHRLNQLRAKLETLRGRHRRIEHQRDENWPSVSHEAENLWHDLHDTVIVAEKTFYWS